MPINETEIVIVEDNKYDAELIMRVLEEHNLANKVYILKDGAEAIKFFFGNENPCSKAAECPKLILLDLKLPKVNGVEVLRRLKQNEVTRKIPVVILTSSNEERDVIAGYDLGVNSYVTKPINFDDLAKTVADLGLYWILVNRPPPRT